MGFLSDGSPLAYKFAGLPAEVVTGVKQTLEAGFAAGWNPKKVAREVQRTFGGALTNAKVTCRTEYMRAYRTASHETYRANSDVCTGWIWMCARQARTCAACWAMDGTEHPLSERMTDHPGGRCAQIPMTKSWAEITGRDVPGVTETSAKGWDPEPAFRQMSVSDQFKVLGPRRYALWKDGKIGLRDMATLQRSTVWGNHYRPTAVKELVASGKVSVATAKAAAMPRPPRTRKAESIGAAVTLPAATDRLTRSMKEVVGAIDSVHSAGKLPKILGRVGSSGGNGMSYGHYAYLGRPTEIVMGNAQGQSHDHPMMTCAHEIGHFLDDQGIGKRGKWASANSATLDKWRTAVHNTDKIKGIQQLRASATSLQVRDKLDYLLTDHETFARSYAQYIAIKSGNATMKAEIDWMRTDEWAGLKVWSDTDFQPVREALDEVFTRLKWLK